MRIGILTYHRSENYGAVLQCYALQQVLKDKGNQVEVIDLTDKNRGFIYRTLDKTKNHFIRFVKSPLKFIKDFEFITIDECIAFINKIKFEKKHILQFNDFIKTNLTLSLKYSFKKLDHDFNEYDAIFVGSDQIWNTSSLKKHKSPFFFSKFESFRGLRISYAACRGINSKPSKDVDLFKSALDSFNAISVRDTQTKQFVKNASGREALIVCDPTMLHDFSEIIPDDNTDSNYIVAYIIGKEIKEGHNNVIHELKKQYPESKIIAVVLTKKHPKYFRWADEILYDCSPRKWLSLLKNAKFVYTDSFHGVIFSSKFRKPFLCYYTEKKRASRLIDLADRFHLNNAIVSSLDDALAKGLFHGKMDYTLFEQALNEQVQISMNYINSITGK